MKTAVVLIVGSLVSFLTLLMVALALLSAKPEWFSGAPKTPPLAATGGSKTVNHDTTSGGALVDTTQSGPQASKSDSAQSHADTLLVAQLSSKAKTLENQVDSLKRQLQGVKPKADTTGQQDWKSTAKLIESMSADEACKILKEMNDTDVKQVLAKVKKRQAGKILAILDPARAAKLLR